MRQLGSTNDLDWVRDTLNGLVIHLCVLWTSSQNQAFWGSVTNYSVKMTYYILMPNFILDRNIHCFETYSIQIDSY